MNYIASLLFLNWIPDRMHLAYLAHSSRTISSVSSLDSSYSFFIALTRSFGFDPSSQPFHSPPSRTHHTLLFRRTYRTNKQNQHQLHRMIYMITKKNKHLRYSSSAHPPYRFSSRSSSTTPSHSPHGPYLHSHSAFRNRCHAQARSP